MNLGELIAALNSLPRNAPLKVMGVGVAGLGSYRGYYDQLAIEPGGPAGTVSNTLAELRSAVGKTFQGYKGGSYLMTNNTPVWVSHYGEVSGQRVVDVVFSGVSGDVRVLTEEFEW